jgi:hypothetical protein
MAANSSLQITELDFDSIKSSLRTFLQGQSTFQDYNFEGAGLSNLLDLLAYNTHYNAYYLNMVGSEMFLDTAQLRSSVVSHAKLLNYTPRSAASPSATINLTLTGIDNSHGNVAITIPQYTKFQSAPINGANYTFITVDEITQNSSGNTVTFNNLEIVQGQPLTYTFTYSAATNPSQIFKILDSNIDVSTIEVTVQTSSANTTSTNFNNATNYLTLDGSSQVYFLQESLDGYYEIYFGDGILGQTLVDQNVVIVRYISTSGTAAGGANTFTLMDTIAGTSGVILNPISAASTGADKETIDSIKFLAPKAYSAQNRAVTKDDYAALIQQNNIGFTFDAVSVWGGEENNPPVYGQIFIALKPSGAYTLTQTQKQRLLSEVIKPISVMTVTPNIVDPDYTYIQITSNVLYDSHKTNRTAQQIQSAVSSAVYSFASSTLNTFNSTFMATDLNNAIKSVDPSIITSEISIKLQKKFYPSLTTSTTYELDYSVPLERNMLLSGVSSSPGMTFIDQTNNNILVNEVYIDEVPVSTGGIYSISVVNPGFSYQYPPIVTVYGDGSGATATAILNKDGSIKSITVTNKGSGYTSATISIKAATNDNSGQLGSAIAVLDGQYGTLRLSYNNANSVKTVLKNIGTIDYVNGIITLTNFNPYDINNPLGQLTVTVNPTTTLISSTYNKVLTVDPYDVNAVTVNVMAK